MNLSNKSGNQEINISQKDMIYKYNLSSAHISNVIHGRRKSTSGWQLT